jgi:hypothetical protein
MADVDVARVQQYKANVTLLFQQEGSLLRPIMREEAASGKITYFELIAPTAAVKRTVRHQLTPHTPSLHSRRGAIMEDYEWNDYVDDQDKIRMLIRPESPYARNAGYALGRSLDNVCYTQLRGTALTGETGAGTQALPAAQKIAHGSTGMTLEKILQAHRILGRNKVPMRDRYFVIEPFGIEDLLGLVEITSSDYASVKALATGEVNSFMGFNWVNYLEMAAESNVFYALACHKDSSGLAIGEDIMTKIDELPERGYTTQVYARGTFGAVRIQDEGVIEIAYQ